MTDTLNHTYVENQSFKSNQMKKSNLFSNVDKSKTKVFCPVSKE